MPEPTKIPRPFADSGDKNTIPESSGAPGFASWQEGFPAITGTPFAQGGVAPKRADFNGVFNALSAATVWNQQGGVYAYDNTTDYEVGNVVGYSGDIYVCIVANGPGSSIVAPTDATVWKKLILTDATTGASGYMSAADKTKLDTLIIPSKTLKQVVVKNWTDIVADPQAATDVTVNLNTPLDNTNYVVVPLIEPAYSTAYQYGYMQFGIVDRTTTTFKLRIYNADTTGRSPQMLFLVFD